MLEQQY